MKNISDLEVELGTWYKGVPREDGKYLFVVCSKYPWDRGIRGKNASPRLDIGYITDGKVGFFNEIAGISTVIVGWINLPVEWFEEALQEDSPKGRYSIEEMERVN